MLQFLDSLSMEQKSTTCLSQPPSDQTGFKRQNNENIASSKGISSTEHSLEDFSVSDPFAFTERCVLQSEERAYNNDLNSNSKGNTFSSVFSDLPSFFESARDAANEQRTTDISKPVNGRFDICSKTTANSDSLFFEGDFMMSDVVSTPQFVQLTVNNSPLNDIKELASSSTSINLLHSPSSYEIAKQKNKLLAFEDNFTVVDDLLDIRDENKAAIPIAVVPPVPIPLETVRVDIPPFYESDYSEIGGWLLQIRKPMQQQHQSLTVINFYKSALHRLSDTANKGNWMEAFVKLSFDDKLTLQLFYVHDKLSPFFEFRLLPSYSVSDVYVQNFDSNTKIYTCKIVDESTFQSPVQSLFPSSFLRRFSKMSTNSVKLEVIKFGHFDYDYLKKFAIFLENVFWKQMMHIREFPASDNSYHEEIEFKARDELVCAINLDASKSIYKSRTRIFVNATLNGSNAIIEMSINDKLRCGNEVVARRDIVPSRNEIWINPEQVELSRIVDEDEYKISRLIKFIPPHRYRFELLRFRTSVPPNFELPLNAKCNVITYERKAEVKVEVFAGSYLDSERADCLIPCESIRINVPIPDRWAQLLQVDKRFRGGSVVKTKGKLGRTGLEKLLIRSNSMCSDGPMGSPAAVYKTTGRVKYERNLKSLVWKINQLPKRNEAPYKVHTLLCRFLLNTSIEAVESFERYMRIDFRMKTCVSSNTQVRSVSTPLNSESVLKICKLRSKVSYEVEIDYSKSVDDFNMTSSASTLLSNVISTGESSEANDSEATASSNKSDDLMYSD